MVSIPTQAIAIGSDAREEESGFGDDYMRKERIASGVEGLHLDFVSGGVTCNDPEEAKMLTELGSL